MEITAPGTYAVRFEGRLSGKRFSDAKSLVKDKLGAEYDGATRQWVVTIAGEPIEREQTSRCGWCRDGGRDGAYARSRNDAGLCDHCNGAGEETKRWTEQPAGIGMLTTLRDAYSASVEPATDTTIDRTALIAERRQLAARLAEIDRILDQGDRD